MQYYDSHKESTTWGVYKIISDDMTVVVPADGTAELTVTKNNRALPGDIVYYNAISSGSEIEIVGIKERQQHRLPAVITLNKTKIIGMNSRGLPIYECVPVDWRYPEFYTASNVKKSFGDGGVKNQYILLEFSEWTEKQKNPHSIQLDVIGSVGDVVAEQRVLLYKNGVYSKSYPRDLPPLIESDVSGVVRERFAMPDHYVTAIDPEGSVDYDDAFHIVIKDDKLTEIGVHIADVTAYFTEDSPYEIEIRKRLTSVYMISKRYNMLPDKFANDVCSLIAGKEKLAVSVIFAVGEDGTISGHRFCLSTIMITTNLTYEHANKIIAKKRTHNTNLRYLADFFGSNDSHVIIEKLMLLANHAAGEAIYSAGYGLIRTQSSTATIIGKPVTDCCDKLTKFIALRGSTAAKYEVNPLDTYHSGLDMSCYTHFTSPIRRFPDMLVHRLLKKYVMGLTVQAPGIDALKTLCDVINTYCVQVKRVYREQDILKLYHKLNTTHDGYHVTTCYPIEYCNGVVYIYLPDYDLEYRYRLFSRKVQHLVKETIEGNKLTFELEGTTFEIELYKQYNVELVTDTVTHRLRQKIKLKLKLKLL